ncbi:homeodomain 2 mating type protein [Pleurotus eryngii]|uniref:Homeodomain 2 mating type protein n=1 Tax=Pleurotus eryngii TaxID=5323 RepID=A0A9P6AAV4_PLEER|nr:homeodomain 2 mating type protein [Pleurotus eryngii]
MGAASTEIALLHQCLDISRRIQAATTTTTRTAQEPTTHNSCSPSLRFVFPPLPDLKPDLQAIGLPPHIISSLISIFSTKCDLLRQASERIFRSNEISTVLSQSRSTGLVNGLQKYVHQTYVREVTHYQSELLRRTQEQCKKLRNESPKTPTSKQAKPTFNHDYVPVLEKYFVYNAYPSTADRALMARKSLMTERQIEVWFQNHRNRARKEGKPLARLRVSDPLPSDVSFESLGDSMGDLIRPEGERLMMEQQENDDDDSDGIEALALSLNATSSSRAGSVDSEMGTPAATASQPQRPARDPLNPSTPPFAYPAPYVPQLHTFLDAASRPTAFTFPQPTWARQAPTTRPTSTAKLSRRDVDAFADLFARLNVREGAQKQGRRRIAPLPQSKNSPVPQQRYTSPAATCAITTILCPGRHPAFNPSVAPRATHRARKSPSPPPPPYEPWMSSPGAGPSKPSTSTTSTSSTAFTFQPLPQYSQSAAPTSPPVNALPKASTPTPRRRKFPQLPRRVPGSPPVARPYSQTQNQTTSHPTPQRSPRPSHHPYASPSRASSSSSSSSSHRVSSSSSSSASSSTPTTPNNSTMSLPISYPINTPKNTKPTSPVFTAQNIVDIFGDAAAFTTPSSQGFSGFGTAGFDSPDFGRMPTGNVFDFNFNTSHGPSIVQARS